MQRNVKGLLKAIESIARWETERPYNSQQLLYPVWDWDWDWDSSSAKTEAESSVIQKQAALSVVKKPLMVVINHLSRLRLRPAPENSTFIKCSSSVIM